MKIIVTGSTGLVGSHLVPQLVQAGHEVILLSRDASRVIPGVSIVEVDLAKDWDVSSLPESADMIIHLAQSENFRDFPAKAPDIFYVNTLSTLKLADYAGKSGVTKFIYASSAGIYGDDDPNGFMETQDICYSASLGFYLGTKYCSEVILDNYASTMDIITLRLFFVYGNGQKESMLIPRLVGLVRAGKPITIQGDDGLKINPTFVADAVHAIIKSMNLKGSHKINVAGPEILSLREIGQIIGEEVNKEPIFISDKSVSKSLIGNIDKMTELLSRPSTLFKDGLRRTMFGR